MENQGKASFDTTRWSMVCRAQDPNAPACHEALESLCRVYWHPLYAYVRRRGYSTEEAEDLTQEFFFRCTSKEYLRSADRARGKFRTFLLVAMKRFLANEWHRAHAKKRGGGHIIVPIDGDGAERAHPFEPADETTPDMVYERRWALVLLDRAVAALDNEMNASDKAQLYGELKPMLTGAPSDARYAEIAERVGMTEGAVKTAAHRMRRRFREHLRAAIAETVSSEEEIEEEIRHLFNVFGD